MYCLADEIIDEDEFLLLYDAYESENKCYPYWDYEDFSLEYLSSEECLAEFRVSKVDLPRLAAESLRVPRRFRSAQGTVCSGSRAFCSKSKQIKQIIVNKEWNS